MLERAAAQSPEAAKTRKRETEKRTAAYDVAADYSRGE